MKIEVFHQILKNTLLLVHITHLPTKTPYSAPTKCNLRKDRRALVKFSSEQLLGLLRKVYRKKSMPRVKGRIGRKNRSKTERQSSS